MGTLHLKPAHLCPSHLKLQMLLSVSLVPVGPLLSLAASAVFWLWRKRNVKVNLRKKGRGEEAEMNSC